MPDEHGKPMAGEWWETRGGDRAFVVASLDNQTLMESGENCQLIGWAIHRSRIECTSWSRAGRWVSGQTFERDLVKHLPDCTGWDWQPQKPPEPGEGWRLLQPDEQVINGDECIHKRFPVEWELSDNWRSSGKQSTTFWYRRRITNPGPTTWHTTNEDKVLIWGAIHNMQAAIGRIEAQLRADASCDKFFESVM